MKLSVILTVCGSAVASATLLRADDVAVPTANTDIPAGSSSADLSTLDSEDDLAAGYSPPDVETDLETLWNELAAEAEFMKEQIAEGRTTDQCKRDCNRNKNVNRGRCRQNCDQIRDKGNDSRNRNMSCDDCRRSFGSGSRRYDRCMESCRGGQRRCADANSCSSCRANCAGNALDRCLDRENCSSRNSDRNNRWNCSKCSNLNNSRDRSDCRRFCRSRNSDKRNSGRWNCSRCNNLNSSRDRSDCRSACRDRNSRQDWNCDRCSNLNSSSDRRQCRRDCNSRNDCDCNDFSGSQRRDCRQGRGAFRNCAAVEEPWLDEFGNDPFASVDSEDLPADSSDVPATME